MKLSLCPKWDFPEVVLALREVNSLGLHHIRAEQLYAQRINGQVYSDVPYSATVHLDGAEPPSQVNIYLNGEHVRSYGQAVENGYVVNFAAEQYPRGDIFRDCYGYIQLEIECMWDGGNEIRNFITDYLVVMLRATSINRAIQSMAEYVYRQHNHYLWKNNTLPLGNVQLSDNEEKSLDTCIAILKRIVHVYEYNMSYFRTNPHTRAENSFKVDDFSKLQAIAPQTLQYIAQHPEELRPFDSETGIKYERKSFLPMHTLVANKERVRETYENRAVLGFIHEVALQARLLIEKIETFLTTRQEEVRSVNGYISSATYILQTTRHNLMNKKGELQRLYDVLTEAYWAYKGFLDIDDMPLTELPRPTGVFMSNAPYRQMYDVMVKWYQYGVYDFSGEEFLLPLLINNRLYEYYALFKMAEAIEANGYSIDDEKSRRHLYAVNYDNYRDTDHINTFVFQKPDSPTLTVYFQPVVWGQNYSEGNNNGISLRRSTSLSLDKSIADGRGTRSVTKAFYTPDYILKYSFGKKERYIIADAKLSNYEVVKSHQVESLAYKYHFSIQPTLEDAKVLGVLVLYGKSVGKSCELETVHDIYRSEKVPDFWLTSLTERTENQGNEHIAVFTRILNLLESSL